MKTHGAYTKAEAESYEQDRAGERLWTLENQYVADLLGRLPQASVLDAPVGTGRFLAHYAGRKVLGADLSDAMLAIARNRALEVPGLSLTLARASIDRLPSDDRSWDLVLCWRLLHLLSPDELGACFAELARVAKGRVCVQCYVPAGPIEQATAWMWRWARRVGLLFRRRKQLTPWSHIRTYTHTAQAVKAAAAEAGLQLEREDMIASYEGMRVIAIIWKTAS